MLLWAKTPAIIQKLLPKLVWRIPTTEKKVWLTFDDGPNPKISTFILDLLKEHNIKATFFCVGKNIEKYPEIFAKIKAHGHSIGNHSYSHLNGFKTCSEKYVNDIERCQKLMPETKLFRPPFGKIYPWQIRKLNRQYKIIMWDVMSWDFNKNTSPESCLNNVVNNVETGSIILFHDNKKSFANLQFTLPKIISVLKEKKFDFSTTW